VAGEKTDRLDVSFLYLSCSTETHNEEDGLIHFAAYPPEDTSFLVTRLWDKYLPDWRKIKAEPRPPMTPEEGSGPPWALLM
jgi:hypothetical protein